MLKPEEILINKFAQDQLSFDQLIDWFDSLIYKEQREILTLTRMILEQSHPNKTLIEVGIDTIPLKPTMTPVVLLKTKTFKEALNAIMNLPDQETKKSFISLVTLFKISDNKRRLMFCKNGCNHEWHNLDNQPTET